MNLITKLLIKKDTRPRSYSNHSVSVESACHLDLFAETKTSGTCYRLSMYRFAGNIKDDVDAVRAKSKAMPIASASLLPGKHLLDYAQPAFCRNVVEQMFLPDSEPHMI